MIPTIQEIVIKNFQSHKNTHLRLHECVNALIGDSDGGKSAVFRALIWLFTNSPKGDEFRSHWGGDTDVSVLLNTGHWVGRLKGGDKNIYYIDDQEYAIDKGGSVPKVVFDLLNLGSVNFQAQMDSAFLLSQTSGNVGRFLNQIADLDIIHRTETNIKSVLSKEKAELAGVEADVKRLLDELKSYDWLVEADKQVEKLEKKEIEIQGLADDIYWLEEIAKEIENIELNIVSLSAILPAEKQVEKMAGLKAAIYEERREIDALLILVKKIEITDRDILGLSLVLNAEEQVIDLFGLKAMMTVGDQEINDLTLLAEKIEIIDRDLAEITPVKGAESAVLGLLELRQELDKDRREIDKLNDLVRVIIGNEESINIIRQELDLLEKQFHEIMPEECPLCGRSD